MGALCPFRTPCIRSWGDLLGYAQYWCSGCQTEHAAVAVSRELMTVEKEREICIFPCYRYTFRDHNRNVPTTWSTGMVPRVCCLVMDAKGGVYVQDRLGVCSGLLFLDCLAFLHKPSLVVTQQTTQTVRSGWGSRFWTWVLPCTPKTTVAKSRKFLSGHNPPNIPTHGVGAGPPPDDPAVTWTPTNNIQLLNGACCTAPPPRPQ